MGTPAAKQGDTVTGMDIHIVMIPSPGGPVPTPLPHPFNGTITSGCSPNVLIGGAPAAIVGATATATAPHIPQGGPFQVPPTNSGTVTGPGSPTVLVNGTPVVKAGDQVMTCNDPAPAPTSSVVAVGTVLVA